MTYDSEIYSRPPLITSAEFAWRGLRVEQYKLNAMELPAHYHQHHLLLIHQPMLQPVAARRWQGGRIQETTFYSGDLGLYPGGEYGPISWNAPTNTINLYVDDQHLDDLARQAMVHPRFALTDQFQFRDDLLRQLGQQLIQAVGATYALGLLYVESLTNALCAHLIEHYAIHQQRVREDRRLSYAVLNQIDAYVEAHADQVITLEALAGLANLSVYHFARLFRKTTGVSPYQYVTNWKIQRAGALLRTDTSIVAISELLGFASLAHFSTVFKRAVGVSPRVYRRG